MTMKQCPAIMRTEAQAKHLWDYNSAPGLWKFLDGKCNLRCCILIAQAPQQIPELRFSIVRRTSIRTIPNKIQVLPIGRKWAIHFFK